MAIANAIQRANAVFVYNERGQTLFVKSVGSQPNNGLLGYTGSTVSIRQAGAVFTYDEKGRTLNVQSVR
jgi:hypothetical protein